MTTEIILLQMYENLLKTRLLENKLEYLYHHQNPQKPLIIGKAYLSTGQEAISVGTALALNELDWIAPSHRDMGVHISRGITPQKIFAQYFCRENGLTQGRDSNIHFACTEKRIVGFVSHMGSALPVANGLAWSFKYKGEKQVVATLFGDGASSQGCVHEAMNYAAVFNLPVIFICNFNQYAISTPSEEQMKIKNIADRAQAYGFEGKTIDGNNVIEVYNTVLEAAQKAREDKGPSLIECKTLRMSGHGTHDPAEYIPSEKKESWKTKDPLEWMKQFLINQKLWSEEKQKTKEDELEKELTEAIQWAASQASPDSQTLLRGVFSVLGKE